MKVNKHLSLCVLAVLLLTALIVLTVSAQEPSAAPRSVQALDEFMVVELTADDALVVDHDGVTGDDRGGIATSASRVLVTGDDDTGNYDLADLSGGFSVGAVYDVLVSDLKTGQIYLLGHGGAPVPTYAGDQTVSQLLLVDGETGALTGEAVTLVPAFTLNTDSEGALFAGYGRVVVYDGNNGAIWSIETPSGAVSSLPFSALPYYYGCENWAMWGIAEYFGGEDYMVYRGDNQEIWRTRVSDGDTTVLATFSDLSDLCSLSASIAYGRWYFHYEDDGQFGGSDETLGYARAAFLFPAGHLDGHVYDELTAAPIEGVTVSADGFQAETDAGGYYTLTLPAGTYTVTAQHPLYQAESVTNIDIFTDVVTTQDFELIPRVTFEPSSFHVTLDWQTTDTAGAIIHNYMASAYDFEFHEWDKGFVPMAQFGGGGWQLVAQSGAIALVSDDTELAAITPILDDMGLVYDAWDEEDTNLYLEDPAFLEGYGIIVWYTHDRQITLGEHDALEAWLQDGGKLLTTGYDSLGSPDDPLLADLVRSSQYGDDARGNTYEILLDHPITHGPYGVYPPGTQLPINNTDQDNAVADTGRGAEAVATLVSEIYDKIIATDLGTGIVVYWNGNEYCDDWLLAPPPADKPREDKGRPGVTSGSVQSQDGQNLFKNTLAWFLSAGGVPWLGQEPLSGSVPAGDSLGVTLLFTATYGAGVNQPGDYYATLIMNGDPRLDVPVQMTVLPPADLGRVGGYVLDRCTGEGVEAVVAISGGAPITETTSDPDTGRYAAWLVPGTYELEFTAPGYLTHTATVDVTAGQTTTLDVDLFPDRACMQVEPDRIEVWVLSGTLTYAHPSGINITNDGGQDLEYSIIEISGTLSLGQPLPRPDDPGYDSDDVVAIPVVPSAPTQPQASGVLLIQDSNPWGYASIETILTNNDIPYTIINSTQIPTTDFAPYKMIIVPSVQGSSYNNVYNANLAKFEDFILGGGVMLLNYAEQSDYLPYRLPPFGGVNNDQLESDNYIVDPAHPIMAGVPNPYSGNSASHSYLTGLAPDDHILVTGGNAPGGNVVMIERARGAGLLIAGGQTYEWGYANGQGSGIILDNMIPYYYYTWQPDIDVPWVWEEPVSGTVPSDLMATGHVDVFFTTIVTDPLPLGSYTATLLVDGNDPVDARHEIPTFMHIVDELATPSLSDDTYACGLPGESVTHVFTVTNEGPTAGSFDLSVDFATWTATPSVTSIGPLDVGASESFEVVVDIPPGAAPAATDIFTVVAEYPAIPAFYDVAHGETCVEELHIYLPIIVQNYH
jgi:hypothetical protein